MPAHGGRARSLARLSAILLLAWWFGPLRAAPGADGPFLGIRLESETRDSPPMRLFFARIDLTRPGLRIRVSPGGADPDGPGDWETTLMTPSRIAARDGFDLTVNGDFFGLRQPPEAAAQPTYRPGVWANVIGTAVSQGRVWSRTHRKRPALVVLRQGRVQIDMIAAPLAEAREAISGNIMLVSGGKGLPQTNQARHPRTLIGLNRRRTELVILVVDGRQPGRSIGMSYAEAAQEMIRLGCERAFNLDGGGSSAMVLRDPAAPGGWRVLNQPSDGAERPVANVLGITLGQGR